MPATDDPDLTPAEPTPGGREATPEQVDAEFARIVAGFDVTVSGATWPPAEAEAEESEEAKPGGPVWPSAGPVLNRAPMVAGEPRSVGPGDPSLLDALDTFGTGLPDDSPDEFVPPPPPPLPRIPLSAWLAVLAIICGFALFFDPHLLPVSERVSMFLGVTGVLGGAAALIMRLRPGDEDDELPPDDGAVV